MTAPPRLRNEIDEIAPAIPAAEVEALRREYEHLRSRLADVGRRLDRLAAAGRTVEDDRQAPRDGLPNPAEVRSGPAAEGPPLGDLIDAMVRDAERDRSAASVCRRPRRPWPRLSGLARHAGAAWVLAALSLLALALLAVRLGL